MAYTLELNNFIAQCGNGGLDRTIHFKLRQMVLAYVEADPHIVHQRHVHDGSTRTNEFAHLREYLSQLRRRPKQYVPFRGYTNLLPARLPVHDLPERQRLPYPRAGHRFQPCRTATWRHVRWQWRHRAVLSLRRVLGGHHALVKQSLHAVVRFFGNAHAGTCFLPHFVSCGNLFLSRTAFSFAVQCGSGRSAARACVSLASTSGASSMASVSPACTYCPSFTM